MMSSSDVQNLRLPCPAVNRRPETQAQSTCRNEFAENRDVQASNRASRETAEARLNGHVLLLCCRVHRRLNGISEPLQAGHPPLRIRSAPVHAERDRVSQFTSEERPRRRGFPRLLSSRNVRRALSAAVQGRDVDSVALDRLTRFRGYRENLRPSRAQPLLGVLNVVASLELAHRHTGGIGNGQGGSRALTLFACEPVCSPCTGLAHLGRL